MFYDCCEIFNLYEEYELRNNQKIVIEFKIEKFG